MITGNGLAILLAISLAALILCFWIAFAVLEMIIPSTQPKKPSDTFFCSHCGDGPWHNSWSTEFDPPLCPNCTGAY